MSHPLRIVMLCLTLGISAAVLGTFTAANNVAPSNVGQTGAPIDANALKPPQCAGINLTNVVVGTNGTAANDLILGPQAASTLNGNKSGGVDCVVGGAGGDTIWGNGGTNGDVCIGNGGSNKFKQCQFTY